MSSRPLIVLIVTSVIVRTLILFFNVMRHAVASRRAVSHQAATTETVLRVGHFLHDAHVREPGARHIQR